MSPEASGSSGVFLSPQAFYEHWQGHRGLTRSVIEVFPDDKLFTFSIGGMRTFGVLAMEMLTMGPPMLRGILHGDWNVAMTWDPRPRAEVLRLWDEATVEIDRLWPRIPAAKFQETLTAFGAFTGPVWNLLMYVMDNEIHHRGQGYVYLRALGIEPPAFPER